MAKRIRRGTMTFNNQVVTGARDLTWDDDSEYDNSRADDEESGKFVRMSKGPYPFTFDMIEPNDHVQDGDYFSSIVMTGKVVDVNSGVETSVDKTITLSDGYYKAGGNIPIEGAGKIPVSGQARTRTIV